MHLGILLLLLLLLLLLQISRLLQYRFTGIYWSILSPSHFQHYVSDSTLAGFGTTLAGLSIGP